MPQPVLVSRSFRELGNDAACLLGQVLHTDVDMLGTRAEAEHAEPPEEAARPRRSR